MADLVDVSPSSFQIVDDGGAPLTVDVRPGPRFEGALFGGEAIGPPFPHDTYEGQCSLLGDHGFSPPEGDWWVEAGHPVQPAMWAAAWAGQAAVVDAAAMPAERVSLETVLGRAQQMLAVTRRADGARPTRAVIWLPVPLLDVVSADTIAHGELLTSDPARQYLEEAVTIKPLFPGQDHQMDRVMMGRSLTDPDQLGVGGLMHLVLQAGFGGYALDALLVVDTVAGANVDWPLEQRHIPLHPIISCPNAIVMATHDGAMFRVTVPFKQDGTVTRSWAEASDVLRVALRGVVEDVRADTVRASVYFCRTEDGYATVRSPLELHHDSAPRSVAARSMLSFDIVDSDLLVEFEYLSAEYARRQAERESGGLPHSATLCIVPPSEGSMHRENDAGISTPHANSEKSRLRYITQKYVACLLAAKPDASPSEVRAAMRAARELF